MSLDVTSLFTNVPVHEVIDIVTNTVQAGPCNVPHGLLRRILTLCSKDIQFLFDNTFYRQTDGVSKGSRLGVFFADIFMGYLERRMRSKLENSTKCYFRYIDVSSWLQSQRKLEKLSWRLLTSSIPTSTLLVRWAKATPSISWMSCWQRKLTAAFPLLCTESQPSPDSI